MLASSYPECNSVYVLNDEGDAFKKADKLSGKNIDTFAGDGTAMTLDQKMWINGELTPITDLCPAAKDLEDDGWLLYPKNGNKHGVYLVTASNSSEHKSMLMVPIEITSSDKFVAGSITVPESWDGLEIEFSGHEQRGTYGQLLDPAGSTKVFNSMDELFDTPLSEHPPDQKVWFVQDAQNPQKIDFYTCYSSIGIAEIRLKFNTPQGTISTAPIQHELKKDPEFAAVIKYSDAWVKGELFTEEGIERSWWFYAPDDSDEGGPGGSGGIAAAAADPDLTDLVGEVANGRARFFL